ncbi:MAG: hypothetical protein IKU54_01010 [Oscillospiraceae bacterium]|nr:hypothetical protein [Oscillospiraceae bacterium]
MKISRNLKITLRCFCFISVFVVCVFFTGNPATWYDTNVAVREYIAENYGEDYDIPLVRYNRFGHEKIYSCRVQKINSKDIAFDVYAQPAGVHIRDNYRRYVADGTRTRFRINDEYKAKVKPVLEKVDGLHIHDADFRAVPGELLVVDKEYDIDELSAEYGTLVLSFEEETGGLTEFADKLLEIREFCDENGIKFAYIDLDAVQNNRYIGGISVDGFPYESITEDNLENRIATADDERQYYQDWQDGMHKLRNRYAYMCSTAVSPQKKYRQIAYVDFDLIQTPRAKEYFSTNGYEPADYGIDIDDVVTDRDYTRQELVDYGFQAGVVKIVTDTDEEMAQYMIEEISADIITMIKDSGVPHRHISVEWKIGIEEYQYWQ